MDEREIVLVVVAALFLLFVLLYRVPIHSEIGIPVVPQSSSSVCRVDNPDGTTAWYVTVDQPIVVSVTVSGYEQFLSEISRIPDLASDLCDILGLTGSIGVCLYIICLGGSDMKAGSHPVPF